MLDIHPSWTSRRLQPHPMTDCNWVRTTQLSPVYPQNWKSGISCGFKSLNYWGGLFCRNGKICAWTLVLPNKQDNQTKRLDKTKHKTWKCGASLVVHWLRFLASSAGGPGSIPGRGTRFHMPHLRVCTPQLKISHASTKIKDPVCCN